MKRFLPFLTAAALLSGVALAGQPPRTIKPVTLPNKSAPPPGPQEPKNEKDNAYYPYGKLMTWVSDPTGQILTLKGSAQIAHKDAKFLSEVMLYNDDTKIASTPGKLRIEDPQNTVTGESGVAYLKKELRYADIVGNVVIVARPKPEDPKATTKSARKDFKSPVTITCDKLRYWWKEKRGFTDASVKITFRHRDRDWTITAASLEYFGETEKALLKGSVITINDKGDRYLSDSADIFLKEGAEKIVLEPLLQGTVIKIDPDEDEPPTTPPPGKTGGKGTTLTL